MATNSDAPDDFGSFLEQLKLLQEDVMHMTRLVRNIGEELADVRAEVGEIAEVIDELVGPVEISIEAPAN